jgi:hypothetical protein
MKNTIRQLLLASLLLGGVALAGAWQGPSAAAPGGNAPAPVNVSAAAQSKQGTLGVGGLGVFGRALVTPAAGYSLPANLQLGVNGAVGAAAYCDQNGQNCTTSVGGGTGGTVTIGADSCRIAVSAIKGEWGQVACGDGEVMTGGGCRMHGGAYTYHNYPFISGKDTSADGNGRYFGFESVPGKMYWGCSSGSTGTYAQAYAMCCGVGNQRPNEESPMSGDEIMRCINPATWTWIC